MNKTAEIQELIDSYKLFIDCSKHGTLDKDITKGLVRSFRANQPVTLAKYIVDLETEIEELRVIMAMAGLSEVQK